MEYIRWKENLSVGLNMLDNQHKQLFRIINDFYNNIIANSNKEATSKVINELEAYIITHFSSEEQLMQKAGYANFKEHKAEHEKFIEKVSDLKERYIAGRMILSLEVAAFIKTWISDHIMMTDQQYKGKI